MDLKELGAYLRQPGTRDRLRVETRPWYDSAADDPHFRRWRESGTVEVDETWQSWLDGIRANTEAGTTLRRVRVVAAGPLNDYLDFELNIQFPRNAAAGEEIRILTFPDAPAVAEMVDFFVINGERVAVSYYDDEGKFQDAVTATRPAPYVEKARQLWEAATPFAEWQAVNPHSNSWAS